MRCQSSRGLGSHTHTTNSLDTHTHAHANATNILDTHTLQTHYAHMLQTY
jgi:hypothetical protein